MSLPDRGDIVWLNFNPQAGREQAGRRPAIILTSNRYHQATNYAVVCPITSTVKGYPFEVPLPPGLPVAGVILADQVKSIDRTVRIFEIICAAPPETIQEVLDKVAALLEFDF